MMKVDLLSPISTESHSTSSGATQDGIVARLRDRVALPASIESLKTAYATALPFPHIVLDDLFPARLLDNLVEEMPAFNKKSWVREDDEHLVQYNLRSAVDLGEAGYQLTSLLHSAGFLYLLSEVTGVWNLLPDPYLKGSGYHVIPPGGKFDVHADRNTAYETGLNRRLALIIYLNKAWKHEYGGQLELWNSDATRCDAVIEPVFNRTIVFQITDQNFHGVPAAVDCPPGRSRNSFAAYYHTANTADGEMVTAHSSIYAPSFYRKEKFSLGKVARDLTPPLLRRGLKKLRGRQ